MTENTKSASTPSETPQKTTESGTAQRKPRKSIAEQKAVLEKNLLELNTRELLAKRKQLQEAHKVLTSIAAVATDPYQKHILAASTSITAAIAEIKVPQ